MKTRDLPLFRARHEPAEPVALNPVNAALDRIEADARTVLEAGGEAALRARLARLLGDGGSVGTAPPSRPAPVARAGRRTKRSVAI